MKTGIIHAVSAFTIWGVMPMYWKQVEAVPALELALHRIVWALAMLVSGLILRGQWKDFYSQASSCRVLGTYSIASVIIFANWYLDIWAVNAGYIVQTSLGFFLTPLINVVIGVLCFKEKLRTWQWTAIFIATSGVLVCAIAYGAFPWVAISLAIAFSLYGVAKKQAPLNAFYGLTLETAILFPPSIVYLAILEIQGYGAFAHLDRLHCFLLIGSGLCTIIPLILFASAAQRIPFSLLGMLQYIVPSLVFVVGVGVYNEPFSMTKLTGFILVWIAITMYSVEGFIHQKLRRKEIVINSPREASDVSYEHT